MISRRQLFIVVTTFVVAFCTIVYELMFAQTLTVVLGGTVLRYSTTIGLFLFSLGLGAFLYDFIKDKINTQRFFFFTELLLAFLGFSGVFFIIYLNGHFGDLLPFWLLVSFSHLPHIFIGIVAGLELPLLIEFEKDKRFARVIGIDYLGSLTGAFIFAIIFYPNLGLMTTSIVVALFNAFIAILFSFEYRLFSKKVLLLEVLIFIILLFTIFFTYENLGKSVQRFYFTKMVERGYTTLKVPNVSVNVLDSFTTPYQNVVVYELKYGNPKFNPTDKCLNLDEHVQMCDSWVKAYHEGMVNVPMSFFPKDKKLSVLILGGGDFIGVKHLRSFDDRISHIDLVDIDAKFQNYARTEPYLLEKNDKAFEYDKLSIFVQDAFYFLKKNIKMYDLIIVDLPGLKEDKMLPLYSTEFYSFAHNAMAKDAILISWRYTKERFPTHSNVLESTLFASGFSNILEYASWYISENNLKEKADTFMVLNNGVERNINIQDNPYVKEFKDDFSKSSWHPLSYIPNTRPNSIFKPNYDMLIGSMESPKNTP